MGLSVDVLVLQRIERLIKSASPNRAARKMVVDDRLFPAVVPPSTLTQASSVPCGGHHASPTNPYGPTPVNAECSNGNQHLVALPIRASISALWFR